MENIDAFESSIVRAHGRLERLKEEVGRASRSRKELDDRLSACERSLGMVPPQQGAVAADDPDGARPAAVRLEDLLPADARDAIEDLYGAEFRAQVQLDCADVVASIVAGLAGGAVDFLLVGVPADVRYLGELPQKAGPLPALLKKWNVPSDNVLARVARVPFDHITGEATVPGMHARNHRLLTPGHDPLIGLIVGVSDILRGGRTSFDLSGTAHFDAGLAAPESNPLVAVTRWVLHIISDAITSMGLPAPGWTLAPLLQVGRFGEKGRTVADLAHFMYLNGYDLRHFLAAATTPLAIELSLIAYEAGRRYLDPDYDRRWIAAGPADGSRSHPKHIVLRLIGDAIASAANAGKIAVYGGNPLALNYAQWLSLIRSAVTYASHAGSSATDVMLEKAKRNEETLGREWEDLRLRGG